MRRVSRNQLPLAFPGQSPEERKAANERAIEEAIREKYPMTDEERAWLPEGVRLARFVPLAECRACSFACEDHTLGGAYRSNVCLKDLYSKEGNESG